MRPPGFSSTYRCAPFERAGLKWFFKTAFFFVASRCVALDNVTDVLVLRLGFSALQSRIDGRSGPLGAAICQLLEQEKLAPSVVTRRLRAMGIRDKPIAPASPWQNGFAERLIGSIRRECLDHIIVSGEAHLRRDLVSYSAYYNSVRTHRSLDKDASSFRPIQQIGIIRSHPILGGLHHHYVRV